MFFFHRDGLNQVMNQKIEKIQRLQYDIIAVIQKELSENKRFRASSLQFNRLEEVLTNVDCCNVAISKHSFQTKNKFFRYFLR